jgi:hypothetical protein
VRGGVGTRFDHELVSNAVAAPRSLGDGGETVTKKIERILAYATVEGTHSLCSDLSLHPHTHIALLRSSLASLEWSNVDGAAYWLGQLGPVAWSAVPDLILHLKYPISETTTNLAVSALQEITSQEIGNNFELWKRWWLTQGDGITGWLTGLRAADPTERLVSAVALQVVAEDAAMAIPDLITSLSDSHPSVRRAAIMTLAEMGPAALEAVPALTEILQIEPYSVIRQAAAESLWIMGPAAEPAIHALIAASMDPVASVRISAVHALGNFAGNGDVVSRLIESIGDTEATVRYTAARMLSRIDGDLERIVPALILALSDEAPMVACRPRFRWKASPARILESMPLPGTPGGSSSDSRPCQSRLLFECPLCLGFVCL